MLRIAHLLVGPIVVRFQNNRGLIVVGYRKIRTKKMSSQLDFFFGISKNLHGIYCVLMLICTFSF